MIFFNKNCHEARKMFHGYKSLQWHHISFTAPKFTSNSTIHTHIYIYNIYIFESFFGLKQRTHQSSVLLVLCEEKPSVTAGFPSQRASNAESSCMTWRHHDKSGISVRLTPAGNVGHWPGPPTPDLVARFARNFTQFADFALTDP